MYADTDDAADPMSTPPPTPTKPMPAPPATVRDLKRSAAETLTDCSEPAPAAALMFESGPTNASVAARRMVTPTPPATPTKPAPTAGVSPKTSSLDQAWTASPRNEPREPKPL